jgi:hypothetical protein
MVELVLSLSLGPATRLRISPTGEIGREEVWSGFWVGSPEEIASAVRAAKLNEARVCVAALEPEDREVLFREFGR